MPLRFKVVEMLHACNGTSLGKYRGWETFAKYLNFILDSSQNAGCDIIYIMAQNNICNVVYQLDAKFLKICNCLKKKKFSLFYFFQ